MKNTSMRIKSEGHPLTAGPPDVAPSLPRMQHLPLRAVAVPAEDAVPSTQMCSCRCATMF